MLSAVSALISDLFGSVFVAWFNCEAIQYLVGMAIVAILISILSTFFRP